MTIIGTYRGDLQFLRYSPTREFSGQGGRCNRGIRGVQLSLIAINFVSSSVVPVWAAKFHRDHAV